VHLSRLNYDPLTDLVPISKVVSSPIILAANAKAKIASIADLVAAAKAGPLSYGVAVAARHPTLRLSCSSVNSGSRCKLCPIAEAHRSRCNRVRRGALRIGRHRCDPSDDR